MTTKLALIQSALGELGLARFVFDIAPERLQYALVRLNGLMGEWDGKGIRLGYNFGTDINAESGLPDTAEECVALNLACRIGPGFGKTVSVDTKVAASSAFNSLLVAVKVIPEVPLSSRLPIGTGNRPGVTSQQYFPETTEIVGVNDGATEY